MEKAVSIAHQYKRHLIGLVLSVALMGIAANIIARYIERYRWIAWVGLVVIVYVALRMIWEGWHEVEPALFTLVEEPLATVSPR